MKVTLFLEGCYPYIVGGVSSWTHSFINNMPEIEFQLQTVIVDNKQKGKFLYELPKNVSKIIELPLYDKDSVKKPRRVKLDAEEIEMFKHFLCKQNDPGWGDIFAFFRRRRDIGLNSLLMSYDFLKAVEHFYFEQYPHVVFTDFLWTIRSTVLPMFLTLKSDPMEADIFHSISTGYAGVLASYAKHMYKNPMVLTEHGIYTREREEEIIKTDWTMGVYKDIWISNFYRQSSCAYKYADKVISLYDAAKELQIEIGCDENKTMIVPNTVNAAKFTNLPESFRQEGIVNIGAILRVTPIKDVKTLINAFYHARQVMQNLQLYIIGPNDEDEEYYEACTDLVRLFELGDSVTFTGRVNVLEYLGSMDMIVLTSISESQPLVLLEGMSAKKPCIATNVGSCSEIIYGRNDDALGVAGILVPVMQVDAIGEAMIKLARDPGLRAKMGEVGRRRVLEYYKQESLIETYKEIYQQLLEEYKEKVV